MAQIKWHTTKEDGALIADIAIRAAALARAEGLVYTRYEAQMDLTAVHLNGCPLRLSDLLKADDASFGHDVFGIRRFINRNTGKLDSGEFDPRFAEPAQ